MKKILLLLATILPAFISALAQDSSVSIAWPAEGYQNPDGKFVVPLNTPLTFKANGGADWKWTFEGATPAEAQGQEVTVSYDAEGCFDIVLQAGETTVSHTKQLMAGGNNFVWNILPSEQPLLDVIALAWYGWYGGTNFLDMKKFAESFHQPSQAATIDSVAVYFGAYDAVSTDKNLTLSIATPNDKGMPGTTLGSTTLKVSEIVPSTTKPTYFRFERPVAVDGDFFVVIEGFPSEEGDGIAMKCVRRAIGELCTVYHQVAGDSQTFRPGGNYTWYQNVDDPASFAIAPRLCYNSTSEPDAISATKSPTLRFDGKRLLLSEGTARLQIFSLDGTLLLDQSRPATVVPLAHLKPGIYVVRADNNAMKICVGRVSL